jgi:tetratricopeptide (TPR) repeat protein
MSRKVMVLVLLCLLGFGPAYATVGQEVLSEDSDLRFAATQHEIISILIREGEYDRVLPEFEKILSLDLSGPKEELLVKEVWLVANSLMTAEQYSVGHQVIDKALRKVSSDESRFTLLMLKGKLYKQEGRLQDAVRVYRQAQNVQD